MPTLSGCSPATTASRMSGSTRGAAYWTPLNIDANAKAPSAAFTALLNHLLLGDRIWMSRFAGGGKYDTTTELYFVRRLCRASLRASRTGRGNRSVLREGRWLIFCNRPLPYTNSQGKDYVESCARRCPSFLQPPDASPRPGACDDQPDRRQAAIARYASHSQSANETFNPARPSSDSRPQPSLRRRRKIPWPE